MTATKKTSQLTEHALSKKLKARLDKMPGVFAFKIHGGQYQRAGLPDWCILFSQVTRLRFDGPTIQVPRTLFVELKSPKGRGKLTDLQSMTHLKINKIGHKVIVAKSVDEVIEAMEQMGHETNL